VAGCVDILVAEGFLPDPFIGPPQALPGWLHVYNGEVLLSTIAFEPFATFPEQTGPPHYDIGRIWLAVSAFGGDDGALVGHDLYDLFPEDITQKEAAIGAIGRNGAQFAVAHTSPLGDVSPKIAVGELHQAQLVATVELPLAPNVYPGVVTHVGWDGEAYAVHRYGQPDQFTLQVGRVDSQGTVVLPITEYGITANGGLGPFVHKTATDPVSGITYVFDAPYDALVSGHARDGTPLPGTASGAKVIQAIGAAPLPGVRAMLAAAPDGAWVGWQRLDEAAAGGTSFVVQRLDTNGDPVGQAAVLPAAPLDDPQPFLHSLALLPLGGDKVWIAASSRYRIYGFEYDGATLSEPTLVLDGPLDIDASLYALDARDMVAQESDGERWLGFSENAGALRVLKIKPGCVYPRKVGTPP
jgi:hypothetical protein